MNQLSMFSDVPEKIPWLKDEIAFTLSFDQTKILKDIIRLYNNGQAFDVDCTYSKGVFWRKLPKPKQKFDLEPRSYDVVKASADALPIETNSVGSIMFDPPFKASNSNVKGIIEERFTAFASVEALWGFYQQALWEFSRVLYRDGILVVKCQDTVSSGKNHWSHIEMINMATKCRFDLVDLFILGSKSVLMSPNMRNQIHARKNHSFFLVFQG